jgi:hypothetical protein
MKGFLSAVLVLLLIGCAGGPASKPAPEWVYTTPQPDATYFYFTGSGTSKENDQAMAEEIARGVVIDAIMQYIGVKVTSDTTATAKASLDSFKADIQQTVKTSGAGRIAGLQIADKYVEKRADGTTVYLLARYNLADLNKEKARIAELFRQTIAAITDPQNRGKNLESRGSYYLAAVQYIQAAAAAAKSGVDNWKIYFEQNINSAKQALGRVTLVKVNDNLSTAVGTPFSQPFTVKAVSGAAASDAGIPDVTLAAGYVEIRNDRKQAKTAQIKTNEDGVATFTYPVPEFVGQEKVTMRMDIDAYLETLQGLPSELSTMVGGLEDVAVDKKAVFTLTSVSMAKEIETGIVVVMLDAGGAPLAGSEFSSGVMKALSDAKFKVKVLTLAPESISGKSDAEIIAAASGVAGTTARVIFGSAQYGGSEAEGAQFFARASATVKVADYKTGQILLTVTKNKSALGKSEAAARSAAFQQLGQDVGQEIANKLR